MSPDLLLTIIGVVVLTAFVWYQVGRVSAQVDKEYAHLVISRVCCETDLIVGNGAIMCRTIGNSNQWKVKHGDTILFIGEFDQALAVLLDKSRVGTPAKIIKIAR